jgi:hypothetical protein
LLSKIIRRGREDARVVVVASVCVSAFVFVPVPVPAAATTRRSPWEDDRESDRARPAEPSRERCLDDSAPAGGAPVIIAWSDPAEDDARSMMAFVEQLACRDLE